MSAAPAESPRPSWPPSGELWSAWKMLKLNASAFVRAVETLGRMRVAISAIIEVAPGTTKTRKLPPEAVKELQTQVGKLREQLGPLQAAMTDRSAARLEKALKEPLEMSDFIEGVDNIAGRLTDELSLRQVLVLSEARARYFDPKHPLFGQRVFDRFPSAIDDIAEAGKCLALERGTATVFHLMRVMEAGLKALGRDLGIPYAPSWEAYIRQLDKLLDGKSHSTLSDEQRLKKPFYQDVLGDLVSIKTAWRNPTMHIVRSYDATQAGAVFEAVCGLMQHLATELSEVSSGASAP